MGRGFSVRSAPCANSPSPSAPPPPLWVSTPQARPWLGLRQQARSRACRTAGSKRRSIVGMGAAIASIQTAGRARAGIAAAGSIAAAWVGAAPWAGAVGMRRAAACIASGQGSATGTATWIVAASAPRNGAWSERPSEALRLGEPNAVRLPAVTVANVAQLPQGSAARRPEATVVRRVAANAAQPPVGSVAQRRAEAASVPKTCGPRLARREAVVVEAARLRAAALRPDPTEPAPVASVMKHKSRGGLSAVAGRATLGRSRRRV
jgi:hypothetical protein